MRCRLSIILLMILLAGCASPDSTAEVVTVSPPAATKTPTPTATQTPSYVYVQKPTKTPQPTVTPTYDPFIDPTVRYQEGVPPLVAHHRLGMGLIRDLQISPDQQSFAVGTTSGVYVFDSQTYDLLWSVATRAPVDEIKWSPSGDKLAATPMNTADLLLWASAGQFIKKFEGIGSFDWSPDGEQIAEVGVQYDASGQSRFVVNIWNIDTGEKTGLYEMDTDQDVSWYYWNLSWSPDGQYVAVGLEGLAPECPQLISILDLATGDFLELVIPEELHHRNIKHLEFSPDSSKLLSYSGVIFSMSPNITGSSYVVVWDVDSPEMLHALRPEQVADYRQVADVNWSPDGQYMAVINVSPGESSYFAIWNADTGENLFSYEAEEYHLNDLNWSSDGTTVIATATRPYLSKDSDVGALFMVDLSDVNHITIEKEVADLLELSGWLSADRLLVASNKNLFVRSMPTNQYTTIIQAGRSIAQLAQSPDGSVIAALQGNRRGEVETATYWDTQTWECLDDDQEDVPPNDWLLSNNEVYELAAPANYTYSLEQFPSTGYEEQELANIKLLDSGRTILDYSETDAVVYSNAVSMDGRYIAFGFGLPMCNGCPHLSSMEQAYILLFDMETETYVTLYGHTGRVTSLLFLSDGDLISGSTDGTIIVWDVP